MDFYTITLKRIPNSKPLLLRLCKELYRKNNYIAILKEIENLGRYIDAAINKRDYDRYKTKRITVY